MKKCVYCDREAVAKCYDRNQNYILVCNLHWGQEVKNADSCFGAGFRFEVTYPKCILLDNPDNQK